MNTERLSWLLVFALSPALTCSQTATVHSSSDDMTVSAIRYVGAGSGQGDGDIGAEINSAYNSLPPTGGTIVVIGKSNGECYDFVTPVVAATPGKYLLLEGGALTSKIQRIVAPPCLNYEPTIDSTAITLAYVAATENEIAPVHGIRDLRVSNNNCQTLGGCGSDATGIILGSANGPAEGITLDNVQVLGFGTGISALGDRPNTHELSFRDCTLGYNGVGYTDTRTNAGHVSIDRCNIQANGTGVSSRASITISNSTLASNLNIGIRCSLPAACDLNSNHFESGHRGTTHFVSGDGVFSIIGGDMHDNCANGSADWWMNFAGAGFSIIGTTLTSEGRVATYIVLNTFEGNTIIHTDSVGWIRNWYLHPQLINAAAKLISGLPDRSAESAYVQKATITNKLRVRPEPAVTAPPSQSADAFARSSSIRYVSAIGNDSNNGLSENTAMATINRADSSIGNGADRDGAIVLIGQVSSSAQVMLGPRHALIIYGSLQIKHPILMGDGATIDCVIPRGSPGDAVNEGGIVATANMAQMIRGLTQDGLTEMFTVRNCGLDGGYNTFTAPGLIDTTGMNDRTTIENNEIIHFSGSACIGASNAPTNSTSFQFWLNNWCNATGKNAACGQIKVTEGNSGTINNIDIENLECAGWTSKYGFIVQNSVDRQANTIHNITFRGLKGLAGVGTTALLRIDNAWQVVIDNPHLFDGTQNVVDVSNNLGNVGIVLTNVEDNARAGCYVNDQLNNNCVTNAYGGHVVLPFYAVWNSRSPNAIIGCASIVCGAYSGPAPTIYPANGFNTGSMGEGNGSKSFVLTVGWGPANSTGILSFAAASHGWLCSIADLTDPANSFPRQSGGSSTTVTFTNYDARGTPTNWRSGDTLQLQCEPY